jgi:hypothetical protein
VLCCHSEERSDEESLSSLLWSLCPRITPQPPQPRALPPNVVIPSVARNLSVAVHFPITRCCHSEEHSDEESLSTQAALASNPAFATHLFFLRLSNPMKETTELRPFRIEGTGHSDKLP